MGGIHCFYLHFLLIFFWKVFYPMFIFIIKCFDLFLGMPLYLSKLIFLKHFTKPYTFKADFTSVDENIFS